MIGNIYVGRTVTHIALAFGLYNQVAHLTPICRYNLLDLDHCLNRGLVIREGPNKFKILILSEFVHHFTIPNSERTSIHNSESWQYHLENQDESPSPPKTRPTPEYHLTPPSDVSSSSSSAGTPYWRNVDYNLNTPRREVISLCHAIQDQTNRAVEQMDHLFQEVHSLRRALGQQDKHRET